jgi:thioredoxin-dependent peroxiredoxin
MATLQPGDSAPDFTAQAHNGEQVRLADYRGKSVVVLYFYRPRSTG